MLKGRFPALKLLGTPEDIQNAYRVVQALMAVHNICLDMGDRPEHIHEYDPNDLEIDGVIDPLELLRDVELSHYGGVVGDAPVNIPRGETDDTLRAAGYEMRMKLLDEIVPL